MNFLQEWQNSNRSLANLELNFVEIFQARAACRAAIEGSDEFSSIASSNSLSMWKVAIFLLACFLDARILRLLRFDCKNSQADSLRVKPFQLRTMEPGYEALYSSSLPIAVFWGAL
jgi:hypothetical protein